MCSMAPESGTDGSMSFLSAFPSQHARVREMAHDALVKACKQAGNGARLRAYIDALWLFVLGGLVVRRVSSVRQGCRCRRQSLCLVLPGSAARVRLAEHADLFPAHDIARAAVGGRLPLAADHGAVQRLARRWAAACRTHPFRRYWSWAPHQTFAPLSG